MSVSDEYDKHVDRIDWLTISNTATITTKLARGWCWSTPHLGSLLRLSNPARAQQDTHGRSRYLAAVGIDAAGRVALRIVAERLVYGAVAGRTRRTAQRRH